MANCNNDKNVNKTFIIEPLELTAATPTLTACTGVYTGKIIACSGDTSIEIYSGLTLNGYTLVNDTLSAVTIDASTIMSGGTNILEIVEASDTFVTGATYDTNSGILTISRNDGFDLTPSGFTSVISHTLPSGSTKTIAQNDMYLIWDDFTINSGSTLDNNGRLVVVNGDFNNFGSYTGSGSLELITTNLEYILNHGNETNGNLIFYTNSPSGWVSGDTISDISAATGNVLVTKEWVELATSVDNNDFTTGATLVDETIVFDRKDALSAYTVDISSVNSGDTFVTGGTLVNKELVLDRNDSLSAVTVDLSGLTNNAGAGLTYNQTTGKIDLGGSLEHNDPGNAANNVYFTPAATGANLIAWGLDSSYNPSGNYIGRFDTFTFSGKHEIHGAFQSSGVNLGLYMSNTPSVSFRQYKDVTKILPSSSFPGPTSGMTYQEFDSPTQHQREIWESHDSNTRSRVNQLFNEFKWDVYNNVGGDNAASKTFFHIESERILGGVVNSGGTKFGIFQFAPTHIQFLDGDFKGVGTFPTSTYLGLLGGGSNLILENDLADSTFTDGTANKRGIKLKGFGETNTETGVGADYSTLVGTSLVPKKYVDDYIASPSGNTFVTGTTFTNNQLNIALNNGTSVGTTIDNLSGLTVDGNVLVNGDVNIIGTATTINSEQVLIKDNIITLNSNVTGSTTPVLNSGFEVLRGSGDTKAILWLENTDLWSIDDDLSVSGYVSGTTYYGDGSNLTGIDDTFVTGGTYSGSTIILNRNDGNSVNVTGITSDSIYTSNGTIGTGRVATLTDTLSFNSGTLVSFNQNVDINANWRANKGVLNINTNNQSFAGLGLTDTTNGYYGGFFWRPTTNYLTIGSNSAGIALEPTANNQAYVFKSNQFEFTKGGFISGKLELSTTTDGFLMPRLTTAQMNAISTPDTHLLIFNTDLNALYRWNGTAWVAMSAGYGIIEVKDSVGNPTFYADLQTALETCKSGTKTVKIYSNIALTTAIEINQGGAGGVGSGYNFETLTIDFNGFTISNSQADSTKIFNFNDGSSGTIQSVKLINGKILRTNATGGSALFIKYFDVYMDNMIVDSNVAALDASGYSASRKLFLGNSRFIGRGASTTLATNGFAHAENFYVENTSTGIALMGLNVKNFTAKAGTGNCFQLPNAAGYANDFTLISGTGQALAPSATGEKTITNFTIFSEGGNSIRFRNYTTTRHVISNFVIKADDGVVFDTVGVELSNFDVINVDGSLDMGFFESNKVTNGRMESRKTSGHISVIRTNNVFENVSFIAKNTSGPALIDLGNVNNSVFKNCNFTCLLDTIDGDAVKVDNDGGTADFINCSFEVVNAGANCITADSAETITVVNSSFKGATTPINSNVTLSNVFTSDPYGNITI